jgi:hypothetical protein
LSRPCRKLLALLRIQVIQFIFERSHRGLPFLESPFSASGIAAAAENYRLSLGIKGESKPPHRILRTKPQFLHIGKS